MSVRSDDRGVHDVLRDKPDLQFVGTDNVAHEEIVGPWSSLFAACAGHGSSLFEEISWAWSSLETCTGTASRPFGGRGIIVVSATSGAIAMLTPPRSWIRSAIHPQVVLFLVVLVEQEVELVKGGPSTCQ